MESHPKSRVVRRRCIQLVLVLITVYLLRYWSRHILHPPHVYRLSSVKEISPAVNAASDVEISVIIPTYNFDERRLRRAINSVKNQEKVHHFHVDVPFAEIIVVNDGSSVYKFREFAKTCIAENPAYEKEILMGYQCKAGKHVIRFVSNAINEGLAGARNFGIKYAIGTWIMPLDFDDELHPHLFVESILALKKGSNSRSLSNPGRVNVIMPWMMNSRGVVMSWKPSADTSTIKQKNIFHCCGMFLKAIWDSGIQYNKLMIHGWEDWDFWIRLETQIGIEAIIVKKPLYKYNVDEGEGSHMAEFCVANRALCYAHLRLSNPCLFDRADVEQSFHIVQAHIQNESTDIRKWSIVKREAEKGDAFAQLMSAVSSSNSQAVSNKYFNKYYNSKCVNNDVERCQSSLDRLNKIAYIQEKSGKVILFHVIITKVGEETWKRLVTHVIVGILKFNPGCTLTIHGNIDIASILSPKFLHHYSERIFVVPIYCSDLIVENTGSGIADVTTYLARFGKGRPNYYSHFTDYYRMLLLYSFGGVYMDTDILLRQSVTHLHNFAAREDADFVNGAILSFNRHSPVMKYGLMMIPEVYDAFTWNIIGPALLTKLSTLSNDSLPESIAENWVLNVLNSRAAYEIGWNEVHLLTDTEISLAEYESRASYNICYHFWGKLFYTKHRLIRENSLMGHALQNTCLPSIMKCMKLAGTNITLS